MTLLEVRNQIVNHFCQQDTFGYSDFAAIQMEAEFGDNHDQVVRTALNQLVDIGLLGKIGEDMYMLTSPLGTGGQDIHVSMEIGNEVAGTINTWIKGNSLEIPLVDPLNLHEGHIILLLSIISDLLNESEDFDPNIEMNS